MIPKTYQDLVRDAKVRIKEVTVAETLQAMQGAPAAVLVDCREPNEFSLGHIPGAVFIPRGLLEQNIHRAVPLDRPVILYCASGNRSALGAVTLREMGYGNVASLAGGIRAWADAGGDIEG